MIDEQSSASGHDYASHRSAGSQDIRVGYNKEFPPLGRDESSANFNRFRHHGQPSPVSQTQSPGVEATPAHPTWQMGHPFPETLPS